eukprot:CAMPEP_0117651636 /NCGR_PEP_ID=MMETSP0804-20121206/2199_1 /TAXON_ID=1074897 /ORGANISM="Tetraselmis astigmatica, Strain CCMP880" /LENGTH=959 /DNA_ID=CAMNT_0005457629 /DNA_START=183 /DNA_END=3065 /DNA_ORIENTATION=-
MKRGRGGGRCRAASETKTAVEVLTTTARLIAALAHPVPSARITELQEQVAASALREPSLDAALEVADGLPIQEVLSDVLASLQDNNAAVLQAPPGAGKTTCVPVAMLLSEPDYLSGGKKILMLEPRRLAAKAAARRLASLLGCEVGETVGYRVRHETVVSKSTRIEVMTEGSLLRQLQRDPSLDGVGAVLLDEFHERSLEADLSLALLRDVQQLDRLDLRLLIMSATLEGIAERCANLLGNEGGEAGAGSSSPAPLLISEGRSYPVEIRYMGTPGLGHRMLEKAAARAIVEALENEDGDVLVFLPGVGEIRQVTRILDEMRRPQADILPLYGDLPVHEQDRAIIPSPDGRRRVILATPIAESSLTIDGVRVVVDSGRRRSPCYNTVTGMDKLELQLISKASAEQRAGRAGRTAPGVCYRLWSPAAQSSLPTFSKPQILTSDLTSMALELALWGTPGGRELSWLDCPPEPTLQAGRDQLVALGATDKNGRVTKLGLSISRLATHPKLANMLLRASAANFGELGCLLAALLSERDPLNSHDAGVDIRLRLDELIKAINSHGGAPASRGALNTGVFNAILRAARQLACQLDGLNLKEMDVPELRNVPENDVVGLLLAMAYPERLGQRHNRSNNTAAFRLAMGRQVRLPGRHDPLATSEYIVAAQIGGSTNESIFLAAPISYDTIRENLQHLVRIEKKVFWAPSKKCVMARNSVILGSLELEHTPTQCSDEEAIPHLLEGIRETGLRLLSFSEAISNLRERSEWLKHWVQEDLEVFDVPDLTDEALLSDLEGWLAPFLAGVRTREQLAKVDVNSAVRWLLSHQQLQKLEALAPQKLKMPSGSAVSVVYEVMLPPRVKVKIQEVFGLTETPTIAAGRSPVVMELLDPAGRVTAATNDLASFWVTQYPEVAKQLRGRYPKHYWPESPLEAEATTKTKKRMDQEAKLVAHDMPAPDVPLPQQLTRF